MWPFSKKEPPHLPPEPKKRKGGFFSLLVPDTSFEDSVKLSARVFQRKGHDFGGAAMDSCSDNGGDMWQFSGSSGNQLLMSWYAAQTFIGFQSCATIAQHWLVNKVCEMPARDAVRNGWEVVVTGNDNPEISEYIRKRDTELKLKANLVEFVKQGRVFGIRIAMLDIRSTDPDYYSKPFNPDGITRGSYKGIIQIDPYWLMPELVGSEGSDPMDRNFYEPMYWNVNGRRIHRSHLIIFRGPEVPDVLKPTYFFAGLSVPQIIYERVYSAERVANEAAELCMAKRLRTLKTDTTEFAANPGGIMGALNTQHQLMNNFGTQVIDSNDEVIQHDTSLTDLDTVTMTQYQLVCAIGEVPATRLMGTAPKGFNATGEFDEASYHETLASLQVADMQPLIERHYLGLKYSELDHKFGDVTIEVRWKALDEPTSEEVAALNKTKADTYAMLAGTGAIDGEDIRIAISADPESGFTGIYDESEGIPDSELMPAPETNGDALPDEADETQD